MSNTCQIDLNHHRNLWSGLQLWSRTQTIFQRKQVFFLERLLVTPNKFRPITAGGSVEMIFWWGESKRYRKCWAYGETMMGICFFKEMEGIWWDFFGNGGNMVGSFWTWLEYGGIFLEMVGIWDINVEKSPGWIDHMVKEDWDDHDEQKYLKNSGYNGKMVGDLEKRSG